MKRFALLFSLLLLYAALVGPLGRLLEQRSEAIKLGYAPDARIVGLLAAEFKPTLAQFMVLRVLFYFGSLIEASKHQIVAPPEYYNMYRTLSSAIHLDPYNKDAYVFAQAAFTWEVDRAAEVNRLLDHGMKYRAWDWHLPYFAGFNSGYFLNDFEAASRYMQRAAEISGNPLLTRLTARYFYEAGREELGILFLDAMIENAADPKERAAYQLRRDALQAVQRLTEAAAQYWAQFGHPPGSLQVLVDKGLLPTIPHDPYGGSFYLDESGKVRSTSRFAFGAESGQ